MYSLHPTFHPPSRAELSRDAAERHALLSAVSQRQAERRAARRRARPRLRKIRSRRLTVDLPAES